MNPWTTLASVLRALPPSIRRTLYSVVTAAGAVLAVAQIAGWKTVGPIDMDQALATYALVSSPTGFLALANVKPRAEAYSDHDVAGEYSYEDDRYGYDDGDPADDRAEDRADDLVPSGAASGWSGSDEDSFS